MPTCRHSLLDTHGCVVTLPLFRLDSYVEVHQHTSEEVSQYDVSILMSDF